MTTSREQLTTSFQKIKHDRNRGVLHTFLSEPPSYDLAAFVEQLTGDGWSGITRAHPLGCSVLIYRPEWAVDVQDALDTAEARQ